MDAPAMYQSKQVPEDVGLRNNEVGESGQGQLHREEKEHKPKVLKKVKDKVKKIKSTLAGGKSSNGHGQQGDERNNMPQRDDRAADYDDNEEEDEDEEMGDAAEVEQEAATEKGGYMADVEDKNVATEPDPEVHGAPMYQSERSPPVQELVAKYDPAKAQAAREADAPGVRFGDQTSQEAPRERDDSSKVRLGDLSGPAIEDPAAPRSTTPAAREGEDIGSTPVVKDFEKMSLSDDKSHVGAAKDGTQAEEWKDAAADKMGGAGAGATYTDKLRNVAAVPADYGRKLASTVYGKVAGSGTGNNTDVMSESDATGAAGEEFKDAPEDAAAADTTTDRSSSAPGYTDKIKSTAAGTTEYGKQLASTAYQKVAAVAPVSLRPQVGAGKTEEEKARDDAMPPVSSHAGAEEETRELGAEGETKQATGTGSAQSGPGYTEKIKSAAAGTTEYGKQLASTVYEKVAGVGTVVASKVQSTGSATPGVGALKDSSAATGEKLKDSSAATGEKLKDSSAATGENVVQDKGVTATGGVAEKLRPGDEHRELSQAIASAVQSVPAPSQVIAKAREAVTSLTGGSRVSETAQPEAATGAEVKENVSSEAPVLRGEEPTVDEPKMNTNTM